MSTVRTAQIWCTSINALLLRPLRGQIFQAIITLETKQSFMGTVLHSKWDCQD